MCHGEKIGKTRSEKRGRVVVRQSDRADGYFTEKYSYKKTQRTDHLNPPDYTLRSRKLCYGSKTTVELKSFPHLRMNPHTCWPKKLFTSSFYTQSGDLQTKEETFTCFIPQPAGWLKALDIKITRGIFRSFITTVPVPKSSCEPKS